MKKSRKIAIFCSHYYPYLGGVENYTAHLAGELKKRGDRVVIVTSNDMHLQTLEWMEGIPVVRMISRIQAGWTFLADPSQAEKDFF